MMKKAGSCSQKGFTLVEIMIALSISVLLITGVVQLYLSTNDGFRRSDAYARLQENGRFSLDLLTHSIRLAGYRSNPSSNFTDAFVNTSAITGSSAVLSPVFFQVKDQLNAGQIVLGLESNGENPRALANTDTIMVRYEANPDGFVVDCMSTAGVNPGDTFINAFYIGNDGNNVSNLYCESIMYDQSGAVVNAVAPQPFIANVQDLQITYGIDSNQDFLADRYVNADQVANWRDVISINLQLMMRSAQGNVELAANAVNIDRRIRRQFVKTITLRNQML